MTMEPIQVDPATLQKMATNHDSAAQACTAARADGAQVLADADSWGPLFYEARRAAEEVTEARDAALREQARRHEAMAEQLRRGGVVFSEMNQANAEALRNVGQ
ncbi:Protein of uncharacterised function (DUF2580) [Mycobacteroides abscessus subsp. bolletii]|uniref:type VII secretion target n=2 Tax=Mycobacteroides abscessus TaxID=36809 RepID=UPI0009A69D9C|nr:type VII secretion target [Mycobacteroides abscessus]SKS74757.1 Protein of uncharacterised function (DUF2580) [Mycobacteroides abscessus subsp. bolletii]SKS82039.1 Protein of uncharacterised function (DUF2580) [Mycobacteroides abscessus subsp. bolletii]